MPFKMITISFKCPAITFVPMARLPSQIATRQRPLKAGRSADPIKRVGIVSQEFDGVERVERPGRLHDGQGQQC